ncbi:MAG: TrkA family potassium uptake protein [Bacteroidota bacterium]
MSQRFAVIGLGQLGNSIALTLAEQGAQVIAIDQDITYVERIKDQVAHAVALDSRDAEALKAQEIDRIDAAVVAIGEDFEALLMTTVALQELGVKRIIARASSDQQHAILNMLGIDEILSPEKKVGESVAKMLLQPSIKAFLSLSEEYEITEIEAPPQLIGKTLVQINLRRKFNLNLITIKRNVQSDKSIHLVGVPSSDTEIKEHDILLIMGRQQDIQHFIECYR